MDVLIKELFIFNISLKSPKSKPSDDEAQDAKLLYYYPENTELLVKRSNVGIIEGTVSFLKSFSPNEGSFIMTELNKNYFIADSFEEDFIIALILEKKIPIFNRYENIDTKKKWLKKILDNFYRIFTFYHNTLKVFFLNKENPSVNTGLPEEKEITIKDFILNYLEHSKQFKLPFLDHQN